MNIDFHSHIMPEFDDGAQNCDMALKMIEESEKQGVGCIVSTSHCYPYSGEDIEEFLSERNKAYDRLNDYAKKTGARLPRICLGAEVHLTCDLTKLPDIDKLCIENTKYMLIEMPSSPWSDKVVDCVYKLSISGIKPIIAHMERNFDQNQELIESLLELDVLIQINASSFGISHFKKYFDRMFAGALIHVIGTDMHNLTTRKPDMAKAQKYISKRYGKECWDYLMGNSEKILSGDELSYRELRNYRKKTLF